MPLTKITKQMVLNAGLALIRRNGYENLSIKTLAAELDCSTQPISWLFGSMEKVRKEVCAYVSGWAGGHVFDIEGKGLSAFKKVGVNYVNLAIDEPNVFRLIFMSPQLGLKRVEDMVDVESNKAVALEMSETLGITAKQAQDFAKDLIIYSHGISVMSVSGLIPIAKPEAYAMLYHAADAFLWRLGIDIRVALPMDTRKGVDR